MRELLQISKEKISQCTIAKTFLQTSIVCEKIKRIQTISHTKVKTETSGYTTLETVTLQWNKYININIATGAQKYFRKPLSLNIVPHPLMQLQTVLWLKEEVICQLHRALYARVHLRRTERLCHCVLCTDKSTFPCFWKTALSSLCQWWKQLSRLLSAKNAKGSVMIQRSISDRLNQVKMNKISNWKTTTLSSKKNLKLQLKETQQ